MTEPYTPNYPVSRETLYELAWSQPMTSVAKIFDVSSSYLARLYTQLNIPRPRAGYWAKVKAGKTVAKPELPETKPGDLQEWDRYNDSYFSDVKPPKPPSKKVKRALVPRKDRPKIHSLISGAKVHFLKSRDSDIGFIHPYKKNLVDLIISTSQLDIALEIANKLFLSFEEFGYRVALPPIGSFIRHPVDEREKPSKHGYRRNNHWVPARNTIVYIEEVAIGLTLFEFTKSVECRYVDGNYIPISELSKKHKYDSYSWTSSQDLPAGGFCLQAYSPYQDTSWVHQWKIDPNQDISALGCKIAKSLPEFAGIVALEVERAEERAEKQRIEWEEQQRRWKAEEERKRRERAYTASFQQLEAAITSWSKTKHLWAFFQDVEASLEELPSDEQVVIKDRLAAARSLIGEPNALQSFSEWETPEEKIDNESS